MTMDKLPQRFCRMLLVLPGKVKRFILPPEQEGKGGLRKINTFEHKIIKLKN